MATEPQFASVPVLGAALLGAAETSLQVPVNSSLLVTAGVNGTKIEQIVVQASKTTLVATTVAGLVYVFITDGTAFYLFDVIAVTAVTASTTVPPFQIVTQYLNLVLKTGWSLRASQSIVGNVGVLNAIACGGDL